MTSFASPRSSKASPLEPEDVPHTVHLYPGESGYITQPPTAYSRSFNGELVAEVPDINPYKYGINFPPQIWQSGRVFSFADSFVIHNIHSLKITYRYQTMPFSIITPVHDHTPSARRHVYARVFQRKVRMKRADHVECAAQARLQVQL